MSISLPTVQPGDLITADTWNNIISTLLALDARLTALESVTPGGGGQLAITSLSATTLNVGDPLTIFGVNFGQPSRNAVTLSINGQTTLVPAGSYDLASDDKHLRFPIPVVGGLGSGGLVHMQVLNPNGQDARDITVNPSVPTLPTGNLAVTLADFKNNNSASNQVDSPGSFLLTFNIKAFTTRQDNYNLLLTPSVGTAVYVDDSQNPISPAVVPLPVTQSAGHGVDVKVRLTLPTGIAVHTKGSVTLQATSQLNPTGVQQTSGPQPFSVGDPIPTMGTIGLATTGATGVTNGTFDSQGALNVTAGVECTLDLIANMPADAPSGNYFVRVITFDTGTGWTGRFANPGSNPFAWAPANGAPRIKVGVIGATGAADTVWRLRFSLNDANGTPFGDLPIRIHVK